MSFPPYIRFVRPAGRYFTVYSFCRKMQYFFPGLQFFKKLLSGNRIQHVSQAALLRKKRAVQTARLFRSPYTSSPSSSSTMAAAAPATEDTTAITAAIITSKSNNPKNINNPFSVIYSSPTHTIYWTKYNTSFFSWKVFCYALVFSSSALSSAICLQTVRR